MTIGNTLRKLKISFFENDTFPTELFSLVLLWLGEMRDPGYRASVSISTEIIKRLVLILFWA